MPAGVPKAATAAQLAKYGHVATLLRAYAQTHNSGAKEITKALGLENNGQVYKWFAGKAGIGPKFRTKVAKMIGCSPDDLRMREVGEKLPIPVQALMPTRKVVSKLLEFDVNSDGEAHIKLDLTMPVPAAMPFLRLLMDVGVLVGKMNLEEVNR